MITDQHGLMKTGPLGSDENRNWAVNTASVLNHDTLEYRSPEALGAADIHKLLILLQAEYEYVKSETARGRVFEFSPIRTAARDESRAAVRRHLKLLRQKLSALQTSPEEYDTFFRTWGHPTCGAVWEIVGSAFGSRQPPRNGLAR
jgi:hypothetical protein